MLAYEYNFIYKKNDVLNMKIAKMNFKLKEKKCSYTFYQLLNDIMPWRSKAHMHQ